jgi:hypothetical protein
MGQRVLLALRSQDECRACAHREGEIFEVCEAAPVTCDQLAAFDPASLP